MRSYGFLPVSLLALAACLPAGAAGGVAIEMIRFSDLVTTLPVQLKWSWHAVGIDPQDNVYVVFGGPKGEDSADCALFQYRARTGERRFIGALSDACKADGTWHEGERIEKGHSQLVWLDGKIYIGTMGFHDAAGNPNSPIMKLALASHGAHLMAYDPAADRLEDCSRTQPGGVFFKGRGFMTLAAVPEEGVVAALTVPHGDLLLYDPKTGQPRVVVPGVPEELGRHVSREVVAVGGKIYYAYNGGVGERSPGHMYHYDLRAGRRSEKPVDISEQPWNGQLRTRDGKAIYLTNQPGELFRFHPDGTIETLGNLIPEEELKPKKDEKLDYERAKILGMALSADERFIYTIPVRKTTPRDAEKNEKGKKLGGSMTPVALCAYDIATRAATRVAELPKQVGNGNITGSGIRDSRGDIYFVRHGGAPGSYGLIKVVFGKANADGTPQRSKP